MNLNRLRPTGVKREDLDVWLSGIIHDAIRDAEEAGMPARDIYQLLQTITNMHHPIDSRIARSRTAMTAKKVQPATLFDVRSLDNKSKGTLMIADFGEGKHVPGCPLAHTEPDFMATLAPPSLVAPPGYRTQSAAVRALREQVQSIVDQLAEIADTLERNGR